MALPDIRIGERSFRALREQGGFYVDKTSFLEDLLVGFPPVVTQITVPRHFGRTLNMSMLAEFLDIRKDSRALFGGLHVAANRELCERWMNSCPVIFLSLDSIAGDTFPEARERLRRLLLGLCRQFGEIWSSTKVSPDCLEDLRRLEDPAVHDAGLSYALYDLCRALHAHYGKDPALLVGGYDVLLGQAVLHGYHGDMVDLLHSMFNVALKDNTYLDFAVLMGAMRIFKTDCFDPLDNFVFRDFSDFLFAGSFGFTDEEVERLLAEAGLSDRMAEVREWYGGYRCGERSRAMTVHCPGSVLRYVADHLRDPGLPPQVYWQEVPGHRLVRGPLERRDAAVRVGYRTLVGGEGITVRVDRSVTHEDLAAPKGDAVWSLLRLAGYLSPAPKKSPMVHVCPVLSSLRDGVHLAIPNREILQVYVDNIRSWDEDTVRGLDREAFLSAFWGGDGRRLSGLVHELVCDLLSW